MSKMNFSWKTLGMIVIPLAIIMLIFENNQNLEMKKETNVYKILTKEEWMISKKNGHITTDLDIKDGFIHLSTAKQLAATLYYFFEKDEDLILIQFNSKDLGSNLVFEEPYPKEKRKGLFPHFYSQLNIERISNFWEIQRGAFILPEEVILEQEN
tara:strand:+ start:1870 stop:2334 length:465 start_codon:yes stop_codon:yes gene_type:complete